MEKQIDHSATDLEFRLEQVEPKVKSKILALAKGIISVYGLTEAHALEEGIIRAKKFLRGKKKYGNTNANHRRDLKLSVSTFGF